MKRVLKNTIIGLSMVSFASCNDWLMETSGDLLIPTSVLEFIPLLYNEGYPRTFANDLAWFVLMTDDVETGTLEKGPGQVSTDDNFDFIGGEGRHIFRWHVDIEERITDNFWAARYRNILGCNLIISRLPYMEFTEAQTGRFHHLAAQAYTLRALNYFWLINTYAVPWSPENLDMPGVIWVDSPEITRQPRPRSSIGFIYERIEEDLARAEYHMARAEVSTNRHLIGPAALMLLQTRVALFQEKWDDVIRVGEEFIRNFSAIRDLNNYPEENFGLNTTTPTRLFMFDLANNPEIIFTFGGNRAIFPFLSPSFTMATFGFRASRPLSQTHPHYPSPNVPLMSLFTESDLRRLAFFERDVITEEGRTYHYYLPMKFRSVSSGYAENWRTVEVFLNLAEAHARRATGVSTEAIDLLNRLRVNRIRTTDFAPLTPAHFPNRQTLINFIWDERRRELNFEEATRWWDLRRQGMLQLEHRLYTSTTDFEIYILPQGSNNWTLQIPRSELLHNNLIVGNPRDYIAPQ
ncbi:MAG: RagB/SusD family nutrient uptake outer membrane protein [Bacteroidales bacterium]|nr:RagB/SusD family nutrient uptake outer membrane protein [Bacteroidales bacterium]